MPISSIITPFADSGRDVFTSPSGGSGPFIYPPWNGANSRHFRQGRLIRVHIPIDHITSPSFRFMIASPQADITVPMSRQEIQNLQIGSFIYLALWQRRIEIQIEVVQAGGSGDHAVFLDHVSGLVRPGVSMRSDRPSPLYNVRASTPRPLGRRGRVQDFRPLMSGARRRPLVSGGRSLGLLGGSSRRHGMVFDTEPHDQGSTYEEGYNAQVDNALDYFHVFPPRSGQARGQGPPPDSGLMNELLNQAETGEEEYNALVENAMDESFVAGEGSRPRSSGDNAGPSRSGDRPSGQGRGKRKSVGGRCPVCLGPLSSDEELMWCKAMCGQNFHSACLEDWHDSQEYNNKTPRCPVCRAEWI